MVSGICGRATVGCVRIFLVIIILSDDWDEGIVFDDVGLINKKKNRIFQIEKQKKTSCAISNFMLVYLIYSCLFKIH
jgi:hypothetical protein